MFTWAHMYSNGDDTSQHYCNTNLFGRHRCPCSSHPGPNQDWCRLVSPAPSESSQPITIDNSILIILSAQLGQRKRETAAAYLLTLLQNLRSAVFCQTFVKILNCLFVFLLLEVRVANPSQCSVQYNMTMFCDYYQYRSKNRKCMNNNLYDYKHTYALNLILEINAPPSGDQLLL